MRQVFEASLVTNNHRYAPFDVIAIRFFCLSWLVTRFVTSYTAAATSEAWTSFPSGVPELTPGDFPFRSTWVHPWWLSLQYYLSSPLVTFPSGVPEFTPGDFPFRSTRVHPWWLSLQEYLSSPLVFGGVHVVQCFVFFVVFCSYIFIVLAHWNNISQVDLLLYSTHFPRLVDIQSLLVFLNVLRDGK